MYFELWQRNRLKNMIDKVVVIGGSGFLGSHTADELTRRGFKVVIFDQNESPWLSNDQEMVVGDILDLNTLLSVLDGAKYLYHFAGISDIADALNRPFETINLNIMGATTALEAARIAGVDRFLYASTMYVYSPFGSFYRASKQSVETIIEAYQEHYGFHYTLLRYGSLYGPRAQEWNGLRKYVRQIVKTGKLEYYGTGKERREYIHVEDAARLSVDVLDDKHQDKAITVTGSQVLTSSELIDLIFEIAGKEPDITWAEDDRERYHYSMTPYRYTPKQAQKLVPEEFMDLGQGVLELVEEINEEIDSQSNQY